jgi:hypothetical protein
MMNFLPEVRPAIRLTSDWYLDLFSDGEMKGVMGGIDGIGEGVLLQRRREGLAVQHLEENVDFVY